MILSRSLCFKVIGDIDLPCATARRRSSIKTPRTTRSCTSASRASEKLNREDYSSVPPEVCGLLLFRSTICALIGAHVAFVTAVCIACAAAVCLAFAAAVCLACAVAASLACITAVCLACAAAVCLACAAVIAALVT